MVGCVTRNIQRDIENLSTVDNLSVERSCMTDMVLTTYKAGCYITFGQPQISVRSVQEVAARFPEFASNIHAVYLEEDTVPRVLKFLNKSCEQRCTAAVLHLTLLAAPGRGTLEHHEVRH